jgi:hypothetical protein
MTISHGPTLRVTGIDYAWVERQFLANRTRLRPFDWVIWRANGGTLVGRIKQRRSVRDYEVWLLNPEGHEHIVVVQDYEIVQVRPSPLELLAAS